MDCFSCEEFLLQAIRSGSLEKFCTLLKSGLNTNAILYNTSGLYSCSILSTATYEGQVEMVLHLIHEQKASLNYRDACSGRSALHWGCISGHVDTVTALIKSGANVNTPDRENVTPIIAACMYQKNNLRLIELLISSGADVCVQDRFSASPLHYAVDRGNEDIIRKLIKAGCVYENSVVFGEGTPLSKIIEGNYSLSLCVLLLEAGYSLDKCASLMLTYKLYGFCKEYNFLADFSNPCSLKHVCRTAVRKLLGGQYLEKKIKLLPLPAELISYISLERH